jgi:hypothetical protein
MNDHTAVAASSVLSAHLQARRMSIVAGLLTIALTVWPGSGPASDGAREGEDASFIRHAGSVTDLGSAENRYIRTLRPDGRQEVIARFRSFSGDPLSLRFELSKEAGPVSAREFGVSVEELEALAEACRQRPGCDQQEFDRHSLNYYRQQALQLSTRAGQASRLYVDVPKVVERNRARVKPVAAALRQLAAERGEGNDWMIETAIALVQDGLVYRQPSTWDGGRKILGFYPPPRALERGYGDCDTKAALLAAILQNLTRSPLVGVHVPQHYLLGISAVPRDGQKYILYAGKPYVLVEAAGPARRRPGEVAPTTQMALAQMKGLRVDPMF